MAPQVHPIHDGSSCRQVHHQLNNDVDNPPERPALVGPTDEQNMTVWISQLNNHLKNKGECEVARRLFFEVMMGQTGGSLRSELHSLADFETRQSTRNKMMKRSNTDITCAQIEHPTTTTSTFTSIYNSKEAQPLNKKKISATGRLYVRCLNRKNNSTSTSIKCPPTKQLRY